MLYRLVGWIYGLPELLGVERKSFGNAAHMVIGLVVTVVAGLLPKQVLREVPVVQENNFAVVAVDVGWARRNLQSAEIQPLIIDLGLMSQLRLVDSRPHPRVVASFPDVG